jgi:sigma-B regulation protein RsbU (phosphoserine phosphatase)
MSSRLTKKQFEALSKSLKERVLSKEEIIDLFYKGLKYCFSDAHISIYLYDSTYAIDTVFPQNGFWPFPESEKEWVIHHAKSAIEALGQKTSAYDSYYVENRSKTRWVDQEQLGFDVEQFGYAEDGLFLTLVSEENIILGSVFIHNWEKKKPLKQAAAYTKSVETALGFTKDVAMALDNFFIHQRIENLISDKNQLKQRIQKDEEDLKRRVLELTVLYDTSNALGYSLNYYQIVSLVMDSLYKVLHFDIGSIFLLDFVPGGEIMTRVNSPSDQEFIRSIQNNVIAATIPFVRSVVDSTKVRFSTENQFKLSATPITPMHLKSYANVPLIFKEEVLGMLSVCSTAEHIFGRNEMTFLHTMANQLASHLGRLKILKKLEKSKIGSLIHSMAEGVVMFDENKELEIINPMALELLGLESQKIGADILEETFMQMGLYPLFQACIKEERNSINQEFHFNSRILLVNITAVTDDENHRLGTVLVFRDFSELHKVNRVKTQRLEVMSKVNLIIKSITDLDNLLTVIMDFILNVADSEMGSIQLLTNKTYVTKVHSNFPDKVRKGYRLKTGESITDYVIRTHDTLFIEDYVHSSKVSPNPKILLDFYVCIPVIVKNELLGIINIARRCGYSEQRLTQDDIKTLNTITSVIGTAVHNALLYQETLEKQKIDQELKIANEIQTKLLPEVLPQVGQAQFGAISLPAREIGGDYYDFFELDDGNLGIILADIVGKGVPAGLFMAMLKSILHTHLYPISSPKEALERLNYLLYRDPVIKKYVPLFYCVLNPLTMTLKYCNAGHEPALLFSKGKFHVLDTSGFPLGSILESDYEEKEIQLSNQDLLLLFTDGIIEARNRGGHELGHQLLKNLVRKCQKLGAQEQVDYIYNSVQKFSIGAKQHDDLTLVIMKIDETRHQEAPLKFKRIKVSSSKKHIKEIRDEVDQLGKEMGFDDESLFNLKLAINEAHANVIEHAYGGSEHGDIIFSFFIFKDRLEVTIKDFGPGMNQKTTKGKEEHLDELEGSGLGVFLIHSIMDKVDYQTNIKIGTELHLTKYLHPAKGD